MTSWPVDWRPAPDPGMERARAKINEARNLADDLRERGLARACDKRLRLSVLRKLGVGDAVVAPTDIYGKGPDGVHGKSEGTDELWVPRWLFIALGARLSRKKRDLAIQALVASESAREALLLVAANRQPRSLEFLETGRTSTGAPSNWFKPPPGNTTVRLLPPAPPPRHTIVGVDYAKLESNAAAHGRQRNVQEMRADKLVRAFLESLL